MKQTFQKTIDKLEKDYKKLKEGKLSEGGLTKLIKEVILSEAKLMEIPIDLKDFDKVKKLLKPKPKQIVKHPFSKKTFGLKVDKKEYDKTIELLIKKRIDVHEGKLTEVGGVEIAKKVLKDKQRIKGIDLQTANLIMTIHKAYDKNKNLQKKFEKIPLKKMIELVLRYYG